VTVAVGLGEYALALETSRRALMISNTIDLSACYRPIADRVNVRPLRVVTAGRISPQKNIPLFCQIAEALMGEPVHFTWIGSGELPTGLNVPSNMTVTGWVERTAALELMAKAHIYIQTSLWEGLPMTVLEASSLGLPILATPSVGNLELVLEGENGFTCDRKKDFVDRILALESAPDQLIRLGAASRKLAEGGYNREGAVPRWRSLYTNIEHYRRYS
jgi:glycosyltransferase involved in cell wall biosynthesis